MLTKRDKLMIAGFSAMLVIGFGGSAYLLTQGLKESPAEELTNEHIEDDQNPDDVVIDEDLIPVPENALVPADKGVAFENDRQEELDEEEGEAYLREVNLMILNNDYQGILDLLKPLVETYNLTTGVNKTLAGLYQDANLVVVQSTMNDAMERAQVIQGITNPLVMVMATAHLPAEVFLYTTYDGNSAMVAGKGDVSSDGTSTYHPAMIEGEEGLSLNPYFQDNPVIWLFLDWIGDFDDLMGIEEVQLVVQGVDLTAYVGVMEDESLMLIGYFVTNAEEYGSRFQSVDWHLSHRQRLGDAIESNWDREGDMIDEENDDEMAQE